MLFLPYNTLFFNITLYNNTIFVKFEVSAGCTTFFKNTLCHSDERFLRGLPISRAIAEESEFAQARPKRRVYIGAEERFLRRKDFPTNRKESKVRSWTASSLARATRNLFP